MSQRKIALVTSSRFPANHWVDHDTPSIQRHLQDLGIQVDIRPWDSAEPTQWHAYDLVVLQSPWSMWNKLDRFKLWLTQLKDYEVRLRNSYAVVESGLSKHYLKSLKSRGVDTVPSVFIEPGDPNTTKLEQILCGVQSTYGPGAIVVKPSSSGGSLGAEKFAKDELPQAQRYIETLRAAGVSACVQPYVPTIDTHGEIGAIIMSGTLSHAIRKRPILRSDSNHRAFHPGAHIEPELSERQRADIQKAYTAYVHTLPLIDTPPMSIRLDFLIDPTDQKGLLLLEIETVAPVKFLHLAPDRAEQYAQLIRSESE